MIVYLLILSYTGENDKKKILPKSGGFFLNSKLKTEINQHLYMANIQKKLNSKQTSKFNF